MAKYQVVLAQRVCCFARFEVKADSQKELEEKVLEGFIMEAFDIDWESGDDSSVAQVTDERGNYVMWNQAVKVNDENEFELVNSPNAV